MIYSFMPFMVFLFDLFIYSLLPANVYIKYGRGPKLEGYAFANIGNSSGTEGEPSEKREKNGGIEPGTRRLLTKWMI